jgi:phosphoglycolate phosphatase
VNPGREAVADVFWSKSVRVFDLDGTLVDTLPDLSGSLNAALASISLPSVDAVVVRQSLHGGLEGSVDAALRVLRAPTALRAPLLAAYENHYEQNLCVLSETYEGVQELLEQLRDRAAPLAICSNKTVKLANALLDALGLLPYFDVVVGGDSCVERKPHPLPLLHAIALMKGSATSALLIGDSEVDRDCSAAAGIPFVCFHGGYGDFTETNGAQIPLGFDHFHQLHQCESALASARSS